MPRQINKVFFLIHPCCWALTDEPGAEYMETTGVLPSEWYAARNLEREVNRKQKEFIQRMGADEVLIIFPSGDSAPMRELIATAERELGERCLIPQPPVRAVPPQMLEMEEPIRHFLEDEEMEGRDAFWEVVQPPLLAEMKREIRDACSAIGYDWSPHVLRVVLESRLCARELATALAARELSVDPATVEAEAFGEGFEQCAMTWKALLPGYLGWHKPIENNYDLSVSGFTLLFNSSFRERIDLAGDIRLFLWEKWYGIPVAFMVRASARLADRRTFVEIPTDLGIFEVWSERKTVWPAAAWPFGADKGILRVPVMTALGRFPGLNRCYLIGSSFSYDEFRDLLLNASISTE